MRTAFSVHESDNFESLLVVKREASCRQFGGQCMDFCAPTIRESLGNDCGNRTCCILV